MKVEVIFRDNIGGHRQGTIVELDDGPFLRALLKGERAEVLNPPNWSPDSSTMKKAAMEKVIDTDVKSNPLRSPDTKSPRKSASSTEPPREESGDSSAEDEGTSS